MSKAADINDLIRAGHDFDPYEGEDVTPRLTEAAPAAGRRAVLRRLSEVTPEAVTWLWYPRIPRGKLTLLDGDPGLGKTTLLFDIAARVSRGRALPEATEARPPAGVVILSAEDGLADTIRPRLEAAGADLARVVALTDIEEGGERRLPTFPGDIGELESTIREVGAALVIIDPLMAYLGGDVDSHKDQDVRRALTPLGRMAEATGAAVVIVRHMSKARGGPALYRGSGSIGIVGAARAALLVAKDPDAGDDENARVLAPLKSNLGPPAPTLRFSVGGARNGAAAVTWGGVSPHRADALVNEPTAPEERSQLDEAIEFLRDLLQVGPVEAAEVPRRARAAGVAERTLNRAKERLGVRSEKSSARGKWVWVLPNPAKPPLRCQLGNLGNVGSLVANPGTCNLAKP